MVHPDGLYLPNYGVRRFCVSDSQYRTKTSTSQTHFQGANDTAARYGSKKGAVEHRSLSSSIVLVQGVDGSNEMI